MSDADGASIGLTTEEKLARTVFECEKAGLHFEVNDGNLTVSFDKLQWSAWPKLKATLEDLGVESLLEYLEGQEEFQRERSRRSWSLVSRPKGGLKAAKVKAATRPPKTIQYGKNT